MLAEVQAKELEVVKPFMTKRLREEKKQVKLKKEEEILVTNLVRIEQEHGPDSYKMTPPLDKLSWFYFVTGEYAKAETLFRQLINLYKKRYGKNSTTVAISLSRLARCMIYQKRLDESVELFLQTLEIYTGKNTMDAMYDSLPILDSLIEIYEEQENYENLIEVRAVLFRYWLEFYKDFSRVLDNLEKLTQLRQKHNIYGNDPEELYIEAKGLILNNKYEESVPLLEHGLAILIAENSNEQIVINILESLNEVYSYLGKSEELNIICEKTKEFWKRPDRGYISRLVIAGEHDLDPMLSETLGWVVNRTKDSSRKYTNDENTAIENTRVGNIINETLGE